MRNNNTFRKVFTKFWEDEKVSEELTPEDRYFYLYILTNPSTSQCGIYKASPKVMAFELGYSVEAVNTLIKKFESYDLIKYNKETREIAIRNWGKYNLNNSGKPFIDCLISELKLVKDETLKEYVVDSIENESLRSLYTSTAIPNIKIVCDDNGMKNKDKIDKTIKSLFSQDTQEYYLTALLYDKMKNNNPKLKELTNALIQNWCKEFDLILRIDKRTYEDTVKVIKFSQEDSFWKSNILSPSKLRKQFDQLYLKMNSKAQIKGQVTVESFPGIKFVNG